MLQRTALYDLHLQLGARMVPFAGFEMPVQYPGGIRQEHLHTRAAAGLFDVSHMGQLRIHGDQAAQALEDLAPGDITGLDPWRQRYTVLTNEQGGIIDDLMVTRCPDHLLLVVNAARRDTDIPYLRARLHAECGVEVMDDRSLLALQGPAAASVLSALVPGMDRLDFLQAAAADCKGTACFINRCGYTGEDGFEISVASATAADLARILLADERVQPIGLGARDTLRLEAGLCLYGQDIDAATTPVEAGLGWLVAGKYRRPDPATARFPGAERILAQLRSGTRRRLTGILPHGRIPVREHTEILDPAGAVIGRITSGGFGPSLNGPVAMGYVASAHAASGTRLQVRIRERLHAVETAPLPFVPHRYAGRRP